MISRQDRRRVSSVGMNAVAISAPPGDADAGREQPLGAEPAVSRRWRASPMTRPTPTTATRMPKPELAEREDAARRTDPVEITAPAAANATMTPTIRARMTGWRPMNAKPSRNSSQAPRRRRAAAGTAPEAGACAAARSAARRRGTRPR